SFSRDWSSDVCSSDLRRTTPPVPSSALSIMGPRLISGSDYVNESSLDIKHRFEINLLLTWHTNSLEAHLRCSKRSRRIETELGAHPVVGGRIEFGTEAP